MPKVIMIGFRGIPHTYGGGEEFVRNLAPRLVKRGFEVLVYCRSSYFSDRTPVYQGVRRIFIPTVEHKALGQFLHSLFSIVDGMFRGPEIVYVHTLPNALQTV